MQAIIYSSRATRPLSRAEMATLLTQARDRNSRAGVTGLLLVYNGSYLQLLEGPDATITSVFDAIREDNRHTNLTVHEHAQIDTRLCEAWSMGFTALEAISWDSALGAQVSTPPVSLDLISSPWMARALITHYAGLVDPAAAVV